MSMFATTDWAEALSTRLQDAAAVRTESVDWVFGPIAFEVDADPELELAATVLRLDVHEGSVRAVTVADPAETARCPFVVGGSLERWKAIFGGSLSVVDGILESKLRAKGDLPTLARHRGMLDAIAAAGGELETTWQEPAAAPAGS